MHYFFYLKFFQVVPKPVLVRTDLDLSSYTYKNKRLCSFYCNIPFLIGTTLTYSWSNIIYFSILSNPHFGPNSLLLDISLYTKTTLLLKHISAQTYPKDFVFTKLSIGHWKWLLFNLLPRQISNFFIPRILI